MGGAAPVDNGKHGRKSLDNEMNLVPFIDLLSCLISFLLITAVWAQISAVPARSTGNLVDTPPPMDINDHTIPIRVALTPQGYSVSIPNEARVFPRTSSNGAPAYDTKALVAYLQELKARVASQGSEQRGVILAAEDRVAFEDVALTMDQIEAADLPDINILPASN